jgi:signal transduction histidine kinase
VEVVVERAEADEVLVRFAVRDTGIGIPRERQAEVFTAFTQVDGSTTRLYGGTGLGLTISQQLVTLMGGRLHLESEPGRGTTFSFGIAFGLRTAPVRAAG